MKHLIKLIFIFTSITCFAGVKISDLPLKDASSDVGVDDSFPYVNLNLGETDRLKLSDLPNLPAFQSVLIPSMGGHSGEYLTNNGSAASWSSLSGASTALDNLTTTAINQDLIFVDNSANNVIKQADNVLYDFIIQAGNSVADYGSKLSLIGGAGDSGGGDAEIVGGAATAGDTTGGNASVTSGAGHGSGVGGNVVLNAAAGGKVYVNAESYTGLSIAKSTGNYANIGMGAAPSASDNYLVKAERSIASGGAIMAFSNPNTAANSKACIQTIAENGDNIGEMCTYAATGTVEAITDAMLVRAQNQTDGLHLGGGDAGSAYVRVYTGGDYTSAGRTANFNSDHSTTLYGLLQLPVQGSGSTPTCGSPQNGSLAITNAHVLCVCTGSAWKLASDGSTGCTF